jgi:hypothetical protein
MFEMFGFQFFSSEHLTAPKDYWIIGIVSTCEITGATSLGRTPHQAQQGQTGTPQPQQLQEQEQG